MARLLDDLFFAELHTLYELPKLLQERLTFLEQVLPVSSPGPSPGQTARIYSLLRYLKTPEPHGEDGPEEAKDKWRAARTFRVRGNDPATSGEPCLLLA